MAMESSAPAAQVAVTERQVGDHLVQLLSELLELERHLIDREVPLSAYGIDSMTSTWLSGELGRRCGVEIDRAVLLDRPSVAEVAEDVVAALNRTRPGANPGPKVSKETDAPADQPS
ncbi:acyl carrier protein [Streptomyces sp. NBC_00083]|uniref:acyl carrier protein n=1 Tax=Streptomyces sp. NBC_00083 TaxID=2975647 RepID=UPI00224F6CE2|nr:acyl carrier protein [Streptomyces sp. NBC_00083]MCX5385371.1 acyl carrier protein [Streptomyces sp. NBC_00083]